MSTRLLYLTDMNLLTTTAKVVEVIPTESMATVILDQTIFYPQGGGQPSDKGTIQHEDALFEVQRVNINENNVVQHIGEFRYGFFKQAETVTLTVDAALRTMHNKIHTAGHLIDCALHNLGHDLIPGKGYHFPQGPYVEYEGTMEQHIRDQLKDKLEAEVNDLIKHALPVTITFINNDPHKRAMVVLGYKPFFCGGTHVNNTSEVGHMTIRKIKNEKGNLRVSYTVD